MRFKVHAYSASTFTFTITWWQSPRSRFVVSQFDVMFQAVSVGNRLGRRLFVLEVSLHGVGVVVYLEKASENLVVFGGPVLRFGETVSLQPLVQYLTGSYHSPEILDSSVSLLSCWIGLYRLLYSRGRGWYRKL